jgi:hypothetical protein
VDQRWRLLEKELSTGKPARRIKESEARRREAFRLRVITSICRRERRSSCLEPPGDRLELLLSGVDPEDFSQEQRRMPVEEELAGVDRVRQRIGKRFYLLEGIWRDLAAAFSTSAASDHSR